MGISQSDMSGLRVQFKSVPKHKMTFLTHRSKPTLGGTPLGSPVSWVQDFNGQGRDNHQANRVTGQHQRPPATRRPASVLTPAICSPTRCCRTKDPLSQLPQFLGQSRVTTRNGRYTETLRGSATEVLGPGVLTSTNQSPLSSTEREPGSHSPRAAPNGAGVGGWTPSDPGNTKALRNIAKNAQDSEVPFQGQLQAHVPTVTAQQHPHQ